MKTAFIYPIYGRSHKATNPYIDDFIASLSDHICFINKSKPSRAGILNLFTYITRIDMVFFNWIEDLPDKRGGLIQTVSFVLLLFLIRMRRIRIFYTLHNKESHFKTHERLKVFLKKIVLKNADFILVHSTEGLTILNDEKDIQGKKFYFPHPFSKSTLPDTPDRGKKYDILIWGAIHPYKGIDSYLKFLESKNLNNRYNTLIVGKIFPEEYENELNKFKSAAIQIDNRFIEDETLNELISESKIVLFTYDNPSVLSSGALIYSLSQGASVIGPDIGAFKDVYREGLIEVFKNYDELLLKIDAQLMSTFSRKEKILKYMEENSWERFGQKIAKLVLGDPDC
jgi:beta-1,4-mannosyltransferase